MALGFVRASSQYATCAVTHTSLNGATICGWIKPSEVTHATNEFVILNISGSATNIARMSIRIKRDTSVLVLTCRRNNGDTAVSVTGATALSANTIYFFAAVVDYTGSRMDLYLAPAGGTISAPDASNTGIAGWGSASDANASAGAAIGGRADGGANNFFAGAQEELRFYARAITQAEAIDAMHGGSGGTAALNIWRMLESSGTAGTITDTGSGADNATGVNSPAYQGNIFVFGPMAADGVVGTMALDGDAFATDGDLACTGTVGDLGRPPTKDGGVGSSTLKGGVGVTTSTVEHYTALRLAQDPNFVFVNLGENSYTTWHLLPDGSPAPPSVPVGTLASPDAARNVTALIASGVTRAVVNVNSDIFRLATVHGITAEQDLKDFLDAYVLPNYWTIFTALEAAGIDTIVCNIQPRDTVGSTAATRAAEVYANAKLAAMFGGRLVDFYSYLVDEGDGTLDDALTTDGTHPDDNATPTLASMWEDAWDAIDAPGADFGDTGTDGDLACTGTVGTMALDGDQVPDGDIGATGTVGVCAIDGTDTPEGDLDCAGVVGTCAIDGDALITDGDLACTGTVGTMALDGDALADGDLACAGTVGTCAIDGDPGADGDLACTGTVGTMALDGDAPPVGDLDCAGVVGTMSTALIVRHVVADLLATVVPLETSLAATVAGV